MVNKETTKSRGDIAEYKVIAELLELGHSVLLPCGDRLPYDIAVDVDGRLLRIQVKRAYRTEYSDNSYQANVRQSQTNRKVYKTTKHAPDKYDFFVIWIPTRDGVFYIIPSTVAYSFGSSLTVTIDGLGKSRAAEFKNAWHLLK